MLTDATIAVEEEEESEVKEADSAAKKSKIDITDDMLRIFVRFDVQRRFFNIVAMEMLAKQFGMQVMPSAVELRNKKEDVPLMNLIMNGRNLSLEQYFEVKDELDKDPEAMQQLIRDRQEHIAYRREDGEDTPSENSEELMALASDSEEDGDYEKLLDGNYNASMASMADECMSQMSEEDEATPVKPRARRAK